ncbi:MAG: leucyl aminopeptidase, partial [Spirochaetota bacterium]|nr:leucyl aminopeptidase [Spirochaetota bacterium]
MKIEIVNETPDQSTSAVIAINYYKDDIKDNEFSADILKALDEKYDGILKACLDRNELVGESGDDLFLPGKKQSHLLIASGSQKDCDIENLKDFAAKAIRSAKKYGFTEMALFPRGFETIPHRISSVAEACHVGSYSFDLFKGKKKDKKPETVIEKVTILSPDSDSGTSQQYTSEGDIIGQSISFARDLINRPGNHCTPGILAEEAIRFAKGTALNITVLEKADIEKMGMGSFLSVSRGSDEPPKFIVMRHQPANPKSKDRVALVGKGVTFDTGGISLKPPANMHEMKGDMSGAASVIAAMVAISKINPAIEVMGIVPATENMPSGGSTKPGDIVRAMNGKTIEVLNTDAEGRLILADALCYAVQEKATKIIDIATLTGACVVALGEITTGLMSNNQELADQFMKVSRDQGERIWQLPL